MKTVNIIYWIFTILLVVSMLFSAIGGFMPTPEGNAMMKHLGFGPHIMPMLSVLKVLGCITLLVPGFLRLKEWAYAGFTFDLIGAVYSFIAAGDPPAMWAPILLGFVFIAMSYIYWHKKLKLKSSQSFR